MRRQAPYDPLHISIFALNELVDECIKILKPRLDKLQINVVNSCECLTLQSDREKIKEIILTLMDNAMVHSSCRNMEFSAGSDNEVTKLHIRDDGIGIDKKDAKFIFQAFYQGSGRNGSGTGLGLSICSVFSRQIGGSIELVDSSGKGAEFVLTIPTLKL